VDMNNHEFFFPRC